jgi:NADH-quinone oxidoreductase subunit N
MAALNRDSVAASEAAMKYFTLGAISSGMLLYGISMIYGATGSLGIEEVGNYVRHSAAADPVLLFGATFIIVGIAFKLGAAPFHMWVPDVYHGTPTAVTLFVSTAPKIAAFAILMRMVADGLGGLQVQWHDMITILAVLSIAIGNVIALAQTNIKRLLAYSTISHIGFLLLGVLTGTVAGYSAAMFYILVYALMTLGGFGMVVLLSRAGFEADRIEDFRGLNERNPWFAFMMLIVMFSTAGVPPTVGFYAKLAVLRAVVDVGMVWIAVFAVIFSVIGAAYYLRVVKFMYFEKAEDSSPLVGSFDMRAVMSANGLVILALGIYPSALMGLCAAVMS